MITTIIKYIFIYYLSGVIYNKSVPLFRYSALRNFLSSTVLATVTYFTSIYCNEIKHLVPLFLLWCFVSAISKKPQLSFVSILTSFTISYTLNAVLSLALALIFLPLFKNYNQLPVFAILTGLIELLVIKYLLKFKRFRKGIPFVTSNSFISIITLPCVFLFSFTFYLALDYQPFHIRIAASFAFILTLAFLIYWWQAQITKAYRRNLELRELESMRTEMAELKLMIKKLVDENERLAKITHRDNTLISALKNSTVKYLSTDFANPAVAMEVRKQLIENIESLSAGRNSLLEHTHEKSVRTFDTGLPLLDELLREMDASAAEHGIVFSVHMGTSLGDFIPSAVSESDLVHTADDLLKNAFKSTLTREKRIVQLQFYKLGKHLVIEVADTGIPFEIKSLVNMGVEKYTTYADGSGIGLMDIWSTKEKYGATYHLDEYENGAPFAKKISLTFDKKNRYSIRTWRKEEILQVSRRTDLQVYDYSENI